MPIWAVALPCAALNDRKAGPDRGSAGTCRPHPAVHLSIVGGDPLVRYRELESDSPIAGSRNSRSGGYQRLSPSRAGWASLPDLNVVVSIDGLQPEHDVRRAPATYDRIIRNIAGQNITIHCTITGQMMKRPGYLKEFLEFWTPRPEIRRYGSACSPRKSATSCRRCCSRKSGRARSTICWAAETVSQAGHAGRHDPAVCHASARAQECVFALTTQPYPRI